MTPNNSRDVDQVVVDRLVSGEHRGSQSSPTSAELDEAVAILRQRGLSIKETAERMGCTMRTVVRHRAKLREAA
jgi:DNA-binding NarL/FixJ family response regulator